MLTAVGPGLLDASLSACDGGDALLVSQLTFAEADRFTEEGASSLPHGDVPLLPHIVARTSHARARSAPAVGHAVRQIHAGSGAARGGRGPDHLHLRSRWRGADQRPRARLGLPRRKEHTMIRRTIALVALPAALAGRRARPGPPSPARTVDCSSSDPSASRWTSSRSGRTAQVSNGYLAVRAFDDKAEWSPDGRRIAFAAQRQGPHPGGDLDGQRPGRRPAAPHELGQDLGNADVDGGRQDRLLHDQGLPTPRPRRMTRRRRASSTRWPRTAAISGA